jgi:hypothetical protein
VKATTRQQSNNPKIYSHSIPTGKTITYIIVYFVPQTTIIIITDSKHEHHNGGREV